eukprot:TRINITY_DN4683_c0_g1_i1.p1 TRINITY_DN4683_c0_g1~~TRINITY_DN4683_c0_g1_i1.p1  ORF type:complete len:581 (-),score=124.31 TRINITY_DN4683_c0_g1_i1:281-2023(-)
MTQKCPKCGSSEIDYDPTRGDSCCVDCGFVVEQNTIISEVTFIENANGSASAVGRFVSNTSTGGAFAGLGGMGRDSREITLANGRRKITQIAHSMRLSSHHVEAAERLFMLAMQHNFIRGRRTLHVIAACLYIVCRREKTPHMLIDFSDVLQTNLYVLGNTFLKFCRLLNLRLPIIDPSLYIHRFAAKLEFEEKTHIVSMTALRLVARMKRDWIQTGRRPSGICGAALLIAARMHGFRRTQKEIIHVVHICDMTLRKRLEEFEETPSGGLTISEFEKTDLEDECYPPAYIRSQIKKGVLPLDASPAAETGRLLPYKTSAEGGTLSQAEIESEMRKALSSPMMTTASKVEMISATNKAKGVVSQDVQDESGDDEDDNGPDANDQLTSKLDSEIDAADGSTNVEAEAEAEPVPDAGESLSDIDDEEISNFLNRPEEVEAKSIIWAELNKEYIQEQEEKAKYEESNPSNGDKPAKRHYNKRPKPDGDSAVADNAADAARNMLAQRRKSRNVNYDALKDLFNLTPVIEVNAEKILGLKPSGGSNPTPLGSDDVVSKKDDLESELGIRKALMYRRGRDADGEDDY